MVVMELKTIPGAAQFNGQRVAVLGLGMSGKASLAALATHTSATLSAWDGREAPLDAVSSLDLAHAFASADPSILMDELLAWKPDLVVIAPGFRQTGPEWASLNEAGVPVWSEIELAWHLRAIDANGHAAPWLCITGTNGKTTTVTMLENILQVAGLRGIAVGNVGRPAVTEVSRLDEESPAAFAFELSSFQLAATYTMAPEASIVLNIADDHLEWHHDRDEYAAAKGTIYQRVRTACVFPLGDSRVQNLVDEADVQDGARAIALTLGVPSVGEIGLVDDVIADRAFHAARHTSAVELFTIDDLQHLAPAGAPMPLHIVKDAMAAAALARAIGVAPEDVKRGLKTFAPGAHRIEQVATVDGVVYVDDSKATNAHAAQASLLAQPEGSTVWIAGGLPKGSRFEDLVARVKDRLRAVVVIGTDQSPWRDALAGLDLPVDFIADSADPMTDAVRAAAGFAHDGDTVLLAPACSSFDQFTSYADRGDKFAAAVRALAAGDD